MGDAFGELGRAFGERSDVPAYSFASVPVVPDTKDEFQQIDQEYRAGLFEAGQIWIPGVAPGRMRVALATASGLSYVGDTAQFFMQAFRQEEPHVSYREGVGSPFAEIGFVQRLASLKGNFSSWAVSGNTSAGVIDSGNQVSLSLDSGVWDSTFTVQSNKPFLAHQMQHEDTAAGGIQSSQITYYLIGEAFPGPTVAINPDNVALAWSFRVGIDGNQTVGTGATSAIAFADLTNLTGTHDDFPNAHSSGTFTIPTGWSGKWEFSAGIQWAAAAAGTRRALFIQVNGTSVVGQQAGSVGTGQELNVATGPILLVTGDVVRVAAFQNSGGNLDIVDVATTFFAGRFAGST